MFGINPLQFIFRVIRGTDNPKELAGGFALGFFIGLTPGWPLHIIIAAVLLLILNVNLTAAIIAAAIAVSLSWLLDPLITAVGGWLLIDISGLQGLWTWAYNNPIMSWTRFNNTMVMGAFFIGTISIPVLYFAVSSLLHSYQTAVLTKVKAMPFFQKLVNSKAAHVYYWLAGRD
jgi:uncharacterized protein (TIGR03546 family)